MSQWHRSCLVYTSSYRRHWIDGNANCGGVVRISYGSASNLVYGTAQEFKWIRTWARGVRNDLRNQVISRVQDMGAINVNCSYLQWAYIITLTKAGGMVTPNKLKFGKQRAYIRFYLWALKHKDPMYFDLYDRRISTHACTRWQPVSVTDTHHVGQGLSSGAFFDAPIWLISFSTVLCNHIVCSGLLMLYPLAPTCWL